MKNLTLHLSKLKSLLIIIGFTFSLVSCSSYQNTTTDNDGIYDIETSKKEKNDLKNTAKKQAEVNTTKQQTEVATTEQQTETTKKSGKYEKYFKKKAKQLSTYDDEFFTDIDGYTSDEELLEKDVTDFSYQNPPWEYTNEVDVNVYDFGFNNFWFNQPFGFGMGMGFNNFWFNRPFGFGLGFNNFWFNQPFGFGMGMGFNNFCPPFFYGNNFFNPFFPNQFGGFYGNIFFNRPFLNRNFIYDRRYAVNRNNYLNTNNRYIRNNNIRSRARSASPTRSTSTRARTRSTSPRTRSSSPRARTRSNSPRVRTRSSSPRTRSYRSSSPSRSFRGSSGRSFSPRRR